jgi:hypothetical protein
VVGPGAIYVNVKSDSEPGKVARWQDPQTEKPAILKDPAEWYAGCHVRATLNAFGYDQKMNKGVSFGLNNLQKLGEGQRLDSRRSAQDDFDAIDAAAPIADLL